MAHGNTRTLRAAGKLHELTHEMSRYRWNILGLCKMRWKNFGETTTEERRNVFCSGKRMPTAWKSVPRRPS